jgi:hypothetical protein
VDTHSSARTGCQEQEAHLQRGELTDDDLLPTCFSLSSLSPLLLVSIQPRQTATHTQSTRNGSLDNLPSTRQHDLLEYGLDWVIAAQSTSAALCYIKYNLWANMVIGTCKGIANFNVLTPPDI